MVLYMRLEISDSEVLAYSDLVSWCWWIAGWYSGGFEWLQVLSKVPARNNEAISIIYFGHLDEAEVTRFLQEGMKSVVFLPIQLQLADLPREGHVRAPFATHPNDQRNVRLDDTDQATRNFIALDLWLVVFGLRVGTHLL